MDREAIEEAIEVLEDASAEMLAETGDENYYSEAIAILRQALETEQEPVAMYEDWYNPNSCGHCGMVGGHTKICRHYTTPPQRKPLTEKRIEELYSFWVVDCQDIVGFARAVERTVKGEV
jgi:hypothetical protein